MVRALTIGGLDVKKSLEDAQVLDDHTSPILGKRKVTGTLGIGIGSGIDIRSNKRRRGLGLGGGSSAGVAHHGNDDDDDDEERGDGDDETPLPMSSLFLPPPEARTALLPEHIQDAFAKMQNDWTHHRSAGMRNWRGGLVRTLVSLI